ncbi:hypothetical protein ZIOFF_022291 [Zingiber officinale]|uniref:Serine protease EDA2 n=1 Tax=Zingiber officinale TaxID=94328 RepID=A0A8J5LHB9_ZINOF|nr:hypothetical protein ZIOFF_022291 [Zingiber officinale]
MICCFQEAYAEYVKDYYIGKFGSLIETYDQQYLKNTTPGENSADRLWWFQVCTEVAYFQVAPKNDTVRSPNIDTRYHLDLCKNVFGEGVYPDVEITNIYYGGTRIAGFYLKLGSKIVFTNGSQDPWRHASKQKSSEDLPSYLIKCHNCGHGSDFRGCPQSPLNIEGNADKCTSPEAVQKVRQQIIQNIDLWLSECQIAVMNFYGVIELRRCLTKHWKIAYRELFSVVAFGIQVLLEEQSIVTSRVLPCGEDNDSEQSADSEEEDIAVVFLEQKNVSSITP